ncbi:MAG TPA: glycosyltransferase family 4 protein [Pyrinomonadaceae bacterium]|jgi:glycosyltransferase involved in cell wall biosynthesis
MSDKTSKKIKVLIVATSMRVIGGQSIQAKRLTDAFESDAAVELEFLPNNPETAFQNIKYLRTVFASLKFWRLLLANVRRSDIVQVFSSATTGYIIATLPPLVAAKIFGRKVILNYHSGELEHHIENWKRSALPTMRKFDEIVVPSRFLVDVFAKYGLRATAIFNFVDDSHFKFRARAAFRPVFLSNRNFEAHYNVADVLRAFQTVQKRFPDAALVVAGFGTEESRLKRLAADLKLERVEFVGKISNDEMARLYEKADVYLNSSLVDNMPLSIIEAFSCGLPVVSYATGGIPYLVENEKTGLLVAPGDFDALAQAAIFLLENQESAKKIVAKARAEVVKYSWENVRTDWLELYARLAK